MPVHVTGVDALEEVASQETNDDLLTPAFPPIPMDGKVDIRIRLLSICEMLDGEMSENVCWPGVPWCYGSQGIRCILLLSNIVDVSHSTSESGRLRCLAQLNDTLPYI